MSYRTMIFIAAMAIAGSIAGIFIVRALLPAQDGCAYVTSTCPFTSPSLNSKYKGDPVYRLVPGGSAMQIP